MAEESITEINKLFMQLSRRAENIDDKTLVDTFVDVGPLFHLLQSGDHQVVYGRRGTGKTHALKYLVANRRNEGDVAVYIDMRTIGSGGSIYSDNTIEIAERGTRLLMDTLLVISDQLVDDALGGNYGDEGGDPLTPLDYLAHQIIEVRVVGDEVKQTTSVAQQRQTETGSKAAIEIGLKGASATLGLADATRRGSTAEVTTQEVGQLKHRVHFGDVGKTLKEIVERLAPGKKLWVVIDEWSAVPPELQPLLADLLRRVLFPVTNIVVKIGAIEHRSRFRLTYEDGSYTGIEIGADASIDVNLDNFMVFDNDEEKASKFFRELFIRHVSAILAGDDRPEDAQKEAASLVGGGFTQANVFVELVRAAEGVPRDALNIANLAAQSAMNRKISMDDVRAAARRWYELDKQVGLPERARELLDWIMDKVIGQRRARGFLLRKGEDTADSLVGKLYDGRVLHVLKQGISGQDQPGVRYDAYGLDFGCYVDLTTTVKAPQGLFEVEDDDGVPRYIDVPKTDYRSIRRAILEIDEFERHVANNDDPA